MLITLVASAAMMPRARAGGGRGAAAPLICHVVQKQEDFGDGLPRHNLALTAAVLPLSSSSINHQRPRFPTNNN